MLFRSTQITYLSLTSKVGSPSRSGQAICHIPGLGHKTDLTHSCAIAAIFHRSVFRANIEASTLCSHSAIDVTMTPDSYLLLRESISTHRTPSPHSAMPPISAAINV